MGESGLCNSTSRWSNWDFLFPSIVGNQNRVSLDSDSRELITVTHVSVHVCELISNAGINGTTLPFWPSVYQDLMTDEKQGSLKMITKCSQPDNSHQTGWFTRYQH